MESSTSLVSTKDCKPSLIWSHFTQIGSVALKQLYLFNKYLQLVTFETNDNYSIRNEKNTIRTALILMPKNNMYLTVHFSRTN